MRASSKSTATIAYTSFLQSGTESAPSQKSHLDDPDRRDGTVYKRDPELELAVNVAMVTGRPLLLRGRPGTGKSSLAPWIARQLGCRYYEYVVTARTRAQDLLYQFDNLHRLADAQARIHSSAPLNDFDYIEPGPLWWLFNPGTARRRGAPPQLEIRNEARQPNAKLNDTRSSDSAVLLIDEIDKADPDVPNNLLVVLGSFTFHIDETGIDIAREESPRDARRSRLLVILTTNEERDLPDAFLRRCIVHHIASPDEARLVEIAKVHFDELDVPLAERLAKRLVEIAGSAKKDGIRPPSTAEYLDALRACRELGVDMDSEAWGLVERATLRKPRGLEAI